MDQLFVGQFKRFVAMPRQWIDHASPIAVMIDRPAACNKTVIAGLYQVGSGFHDSRQAEQQK